jgi:hypothetical protein
MFFSRLFFFLISIFYIHIYPPCVFFLSFKKKKKIDIEILEFENPTSPYKEAVSAYQCGNGHVSWNCRVAVRKGPHVVRLENGQAQIDCRGVEVPAATPNGLSVTRNGGHLVVKSPDSGLEVTFAGSELSIRVFEPRSGVLRGMCGDFNGNPADDVGGEAMRHRNQPSWSYVSRWIVPAHKSLLECRLGAGELGLLETGAAVSVRTRAKERASSRARNGMSERARAWAADDDATVNGRPVLAPPDATAKQVLGGENTFFIYINLTFFFEI